MTEADRKLIKEALKEAWDERAVTYANGAVKFANALTDSWAGVIQAFDGFFLKNFIEDKPEAARAIVDARLTAAKRARDLMTEHIREVESLAARLPKPKSRARSKKR